MRHSFVFFFLLFLSFLNAQDTNIPFGDAVYHIYDRLEIKTGISSPIHSSLKAFSRKEITQYALSVDTAATKLSFKDRFDLYRIFKNNNEWLLPADYFQAQSHRRNELFVYVDSLNGYRKIIESQTSLSEQNPRYTLSKKPVLKTIYQTPANFFEKNTDSYYVRANPLMNLKFGKIKADEDMLLTNHRGLALRFGVDSKVYGYIDIIASQNHFPEYVSERITKDKALPGNGLYKYFNELHWFKNTAGYDYLNSQGYIGFNVTNHIGVQFGHGKNFIGNGYRSMLLSDFSNNYLYLKLNTKVWKFHYQNIFAEMTAKSANEIPGDKIVPKKYFAAHYLSFKPTDNIQIGIYEAVIFQRESGFELQYLNPVILYRTVEHLVG
ncbi:MAG: hypothetical protein GY705_26245, partial [Bacteroidetes bacterium]|nr:hypothetical protein [Bacteroidota bacterium]